MLKEIPNVSQTPGEQRRRWFTDENLDLIIWLDDADTIQGFQIAYDKKDQQKALTWFPDKGFSHNIIDEGENRPGRYKSTPILVVDGIFDLPHITNSFNAASSTIEHRIATFVSTVLTNAIPSA